jgi:hypothetical protein
LNSEFYWSGEVLMQMKRAINEIPGISEDARDLEGTTKI